MSGPFFCQEHGSQDPELIMYQMLRQLLFLLPPEVSHDLSLKGLNIVSKTPAANLLSGKGFGGKEATGHNILGLHFPNRVGLAAGLDKNGDYFNALGNVGFGFVEIGTITPKAQDGNPKPRLFRIPESEAIINRMGFNNKGVDHLVEEVKKRTFDGVLGINIGKNLTTSVEDALSDYIKALRSVYPVADYVTVNISSPNTPGLRLLQHGDALRGLISGLKQEQAVLLEKHARNVPMLLKVAPDLSEEELVDMAQIFREEGVDGVIATNTTSGRIGVESSPLAGEAGGLSGRPVFDVATDALRNFREELPNEIPLIAAGGVSSAGDARKKMEAGADLVQIYSGFIYQGPRLIHECIKELG